MVLARYEAAVQDIAGLLYNAFGTAVEGIQLSVPEVPKVGSPVALGQAIALDFNDSWWTAWWRRTRGYKAFSKRFRSLIEGETEDFMTQLKTVQTADARRSMLARLQAFFEEQHDILLEIGSCGHKGDDVHGLFDEKANRERQEQTSAVLNILRTYSA